MSGNATKCHTIWLTERKLEAANLLAEGELTQTEIAARLGVSDRQLRRWTKHPEFAAAIRSHLDEYSRELRKTWLADFRASYK